MSKGLGVWVNEGEVLSLNVGYLMSHLLQLGKTRSKVQDRKGGRVGVFSVRFLSVVDRLGLSGLESGENGLALSFSGVRHLPIRLI